MEEALRELIGIIEVANQKILWDYLLIIIPIIVSIIAIGISIYTAKVQNKISLFEKRYQIFSLLAFIMSVGDMIVLYEGVDAKIPLQGGMSTYYTVFKISEKADEENYSSFYTNILLKLGQTKYLFDGVDVEPIMTYLEIFSKYVSKVRMGVPSDIEFKKLKETRSIIENSDVLKKMENRIKL